MQANTYLSSKEILRVNWHLSVLVCMAADHKPGQWSMIFVIHVSASSFGLSGLHDCWFVFTLKWCVCWRIVASVGKTASNASLRAPVISQMLQTHPDVFQEAAGVLQYLRDTVSSRLDSPGPVDVGVECASMLERLMLAQAQVCHYFNWKCTSLHKWLHLWVCTRTHCKHVNFSVTDIPSTSQQNTMQPTSRSSGSLTL